MERYDALATILPENLNIGAISPRSLVDELDRQSATSCSVGVYANSDSRKLLRQFIDETFKLAAQQRGVINGDFMQMLSTENAQDFISNMGSDEKYMYVSHLFFIFS